MKYYYYLYYRIYKLLSKIRSSTPHFSACLNISAFVFFLTLSLYLIFFLKSFSNVHSLIIIFSINIVTLLINLFIFFYKKRNLKIVEMFKNETETQKSISTIIVYLIFISNLVLFIYALSSI